MIVELNQKIMQETGSPIIAYSLRDLDDSNYNVTNGYLHDNGKNEQKDDSGHHVIMKYRTLRRREIENYLIIPSAISRYISAKCKDSSVPKDVASVNQYLNVEHGLFVPDSYKVSERESNTEGLFGKDVKKVLDGVNAYFKVKFDREEYVSDIKADEVCDDLVTIVDELIEMCG